MRKTFAAIIVICAIYFIGGGIAVYFNLFDKAVYIEYTGIVGGLASVTGLVALTRPALSKSDVQAIEIDALKSMAETASQLQKLETERSKTKVEIDALELKKREMELLVKKASLALFLKEQHAQHERQIVEEIERNAQLKYNIDKADEFEKKLTALNEEIESNSNVEQLKEIITAASRKSVPVDELIKSLPFPLNALMNSALMINKAMASSVFPFK